MGIIALFHDQVGMLRCRPRAEHHRRVPELSVGVTYLPIPAAGAITLLFVIERLWLGEPPATSFTFRDQPQSNRSWTPSFCWCVPGIHVHRHPRGLCHGTGDAGHRAMDRHAARAIMIAISDACRSSRPSPSRSSCWPAPSCRKAAWQGGLVDLARSSSASSAAVSRW